MIAEGSSSSSQTPVPGVEPSPASERDLLAERRARRAAESGETALVRRAEAAEATVKTLETHISSLQRRLDEAEGDSRRTFELAERLEHVESALQAIRESHRRMALTVSELKDVAVRLRAAIDRGPVQEPARPRSEDMAEALAAAVERLRARAETTSAVSATPSVPPVVRAPHKHSMSLIGRWRIRRKQRRGR
jgi:TolA-binding protein